MCSRRGSPGRQLRAICAHVYVLGSVSRSEERSLHVLGEGAGVQVTLCPPCLPTRLSNRVLGCPCRDVRPVHYYDELHVLHILVGLIISFALAKTRTLIKLPKGHDSVQTTSSIWKLPFPSSPQRLAYQESSGSPFRTQLTGDNISNNSRILCGPYAASH